MIYRITDHVVIDNHGYRVLKDGLPINYSSEDLEDVNTLEIDKAIIYINTLQKAKDRKISSYVLKHEAEKYLRQNDYYNKKDEAYISNGSMIVALIQSGYEYDLISKSGLPIKEDISINVLFNVLKSSL